MQHTGEREQSEARTRLEMAMQGSQKEALIHFDECEVPAPAPKFGERGGGPGTVEQKRHGETGPAQQPWKQVADAEVDREEKCCNPRETKKPVRNARGVDREQDDPC